MQGNVLPKWTFFHVLAHFVRKKKSSMSLDSARAFLKISAPCPPKIGDYLKIKIHTRALDRLISNNILEKSTLQLSERPTFCKFPKAEPD